VGDQKEKKEWDVASGKDATRLTSFLLLFLSQLGPALPPSSWSPPAMRCPLTEPAKMGLLSSGLHQTPLSSFAELSFISD
jgi:hypothetical protein